MTSAASSTITAIIQIFYLFLLDRTEKNNGNIRLVQEGQEWPIRNHEWRKQGRNPDQANENRNRTYPYQVQNRQR